MNQKVRGEKDFFLMGAGIGADLVLGHNLFLRSDWGIALHEANGVAKNHEEFYFSGSLIY